MFHVMLALPVLTAFGVMAGLVLTALVGLLGVVFLFEWLVCLFCKRRRWLLWLPAVLAAALCGGLFLLFSLPVSFILIYFGLYALCALAGLGAAWLCGKVYQDIRK